MKLKFTGKTAIISGGSGGIGLSIVKKLIESKIYTLILDIKNPPKKILSNKFVSFYQLDLTNYKETKKIVLQFRKSKKRIDYLINAAGVLLFNKDVGVEKIDLKIWNKVFDINLNSMIYLLKNVLPIMKKRKFGSIVNISSVDALSGDDKPQDAYGASKAAMIRLSKSIAIQYAKQQIRSNTILPGPVETPMQERWKVNPSAKKNLINYIPLSRIGKPDDIANTVMFLLSDNSNFITGTEIIIDGGITAKP